MAVQPATNFSQVPQARTLVSEQEIDAAYRAVLGRPADAGGLAHFKSVAEGYQLTFGRLVHILADSEEFRSRPSADQEKAWDAIQANSHPSESVHWFHSITLPDGYVTNGMQVQESVDRIFKYSVAGKSVLDIGAWDGYYSFAAEQRGASDVLATDWFCWEGAGWGTKAGFDFAKKTLNSKVRERKIDVFSLDPSLLGKFDVVLFLGVLYHLVDPFGGLMKAASMCTDHIVILTHTRNNELKKPVAEYVANLNGDATTFWYHNLACIEAMLRDCGFHRFEALEAPPGPENGEPRHVIHAWRT
jgi:tRNA (mo5U34)-methyltransferase